MSLVRSNSLVPRTRQPRQSRREFISGESHWFEGRRYRLAVVESTGRTGMRLRPATGRDAREAMLYRWYRARLRERVPVILAEWEPRNRRARGRLAYPPNEESVGHVQRGGPPHRAQLRTGQELVEPSHNERFREIMDRAMPGWPLRVDELSRSHLPDEGWEVSPNRD